LGGPYGTINISLYLLLFSSFPQSKFEYRIFNLVAPGIRVGDIRDTNVFISVFSSMFMEILIMKKSPLLIEVFYYFITFYVKNSGRSFV